MSKRTLTTLKDIVESTEILPKIPYVPPHGPTHFVDADGDLQPRTRPPEHVVVPKPTFDVTDWSTEREIDRLKREDSTICNDCGNPEATDHQCEDCRHAAMERLL